MGVVRAEHLKHPILYGVGIGLILASSTLAFVFAFAGSGDAPLALKYLPGAFAIFGTVLLFLGWYRKRRGGERSRADRAT